MATANQIGKVSTALDESVAMLALIQGGGDPTIEISIDKTKTEIDTALTIESPSKEHLEKFFEARISRLYAKLQEMTEGVLG